MCSETFVNISDLDNHLSEHMDDETNSNSCKPCDESFPSETDFEAHISEIHSTSSNLSSFSVRMDQLDGNI